MSQRHYYIDGICHDCPRRPPEPPPNVCYNVRMPWWSEWWMLLIYLAALVVGFGIGSGQL